MSVFRVNLFNSFDNVISREAFSVPNSTHSKLGKLEEGSDWKIVEDIKKGNVILMCRGIRQIWGIAIATDDCKITDVDAFEEVMRYEEDGFRFISIDVYREFKSPIDGKVFFKGLLNENPFEDDQFCIKLNYEKKNTQKFTDAMNKLLSSH